MPLKAHNITYRILELHYKKDVDLWINAWIFIRLIFINEIFIKMTKQKLRDEWSLKKKDEY